VDNLLPFFGAFSVLFVMLLGALWLAWMILWILVPFSLFAIRRQVDEQTQTAHRMEKQLAELLQITRAMRDASPQAENPAKSPPPPLPGF